MKKSLFVSLLLMILPISAMGITVDGDLSDWSVNPLLNYWVPGVNEVKNGTIGPGYYDTDSPLKGKSLGINYWVEYGYVIHDGNKYFVGPGYGTECDIKAMYAYYSSDYLYLAIALGDESGVGRIGDIGLSLDEGSTYAYGIALQDKNGLIPGHLYSATASTSGTTYPGWNDIDSGWQGTTHWISNPGRLAAGSSDLGGIGYFFGKNDLYGFYVIEAAIPLTLTGGDINFVHLTQMCGNDLGNLPVDPIPEPNTLLLLGASLLGFAGFRRKV